MDPDADADADAVVEQDFSPFVLVYRSGRVHRLFGNDIVPAGTDAATGTASKDVIIDPSTGLAVRLYLPSTARRGERLPIFVYIHGGAFLVESAFNPNHHRYLNTLAAGAGAVAVSVNYRLAPEHPLPAAYDDSFSALLWAVTLQDTWLADHGDQTRVVVAGVSAGANIAHNIVMRAADGELPGGARIAGMALQHPYFGVPITGDTDRAKRFGSFWSFVSAGGIGLEHPAASPFGHPELWRRLPCRQVLVTVAETDRLYKVGMKYADGIKESGWDGEVEVYETKGEDHCFFLEKPDGEAAAGEVDAVTAFVKRAAP